MLGKGRDTFQRTLTMMGFKHLFTFLHSIISFSFKNGNKMAATKGSKKAIVKKAPPTGEKKKRRAKRKESFSIYVYKVLKQVHPDT